MTLATCRRCGTAPFLLEALLAADDGHERARDGLPRRAVGALEARAALGLLLLIRFGLFARSGGGVAFGGWDLGHAFGRRRARRWRLLDQGWGWCSGGGDLMGRAARAACGLSELCQQHTELVWGAVRVSFSRARLSS